MEVELIQEYNANESLRNIVPGSEFQTTASIRILALVLRWEADRISWPRNITIAVQSCRDATVEVFIEHHLSSRGRKSSPSNATSTLYIVHRFSGSLPTSKYVRPGNLP